jgi:hypothetical protein
MNDELKRRPANLLQCIIPHSSFRNQVGPVLLNKRTSTRGVAASLTTEFSFLSQDEPFRGGLLPAPLSPLNAVGTWAVKFLDSRLLTLDSGLYYPRPPFFLIRRRKCRRGKPGCAPLAVSVCFRREIPRDSGAAPFLGLRRIRGRVQTKRVSNGRGRRRRIGSEPQKWDLGFILRIRVHPLNPCPSGWDSSALLFAFDS